MLLAMDLAIAGTLVWLVARARRAAGTAERAVQSDHRRPNTPAGRRLGGSRCRPRSPLWLGNLSLSAMLTSAVLDTSYLALVMYAGATVLVALFRVLLARPGPARPGARNTSSLIDAGARIGRTPMAVACVVIGPQAFRVYRPLSDFLLTILSYGFTIGVVSLSLREHRGVRGRRLPGLLAGAHDPHAAGRGHPAFARPHAWRGQQHLDPDLLHDPAGRPAVGAGRAGLPDRTAGHRVRCPRRRYRLRAAGRREELRRRPDPDVRAADPAGRRGRRRGHVRHGAPDRHAGHHRDHLRRRRRGGAQRHAAGRQAGQLDAAGHPSAHRHQRQHRPRRAPAPPSSCCLRSPAASTAWPRCRNPPPS